MLSSRPANLFPEGRAAKTPGRENHVHRGAMTVHGKGKGNAAVAPVQQPFSAQPQKISKNATQLVTRPLVDKTPFPNRAATDKFNTPFPAGENGQKIAKLVLHDTNKPTALTPSYPHLNGTPDSVARPSSARRHDRIPHSGSKNFQTPLINGNPWDVSELDIVVPASEEVEAPVVETDDYDEIEYMPPNTLDVPYTPPFDFPLPDYKAVGTSLLQLAHSYPYDDAQPSEIDPTPDATLFTPMPELPLPAIEPDDPFFDTRPQPVKPSAQTTRRTQPSSRSTTLASRPGTVASSVRSTFGRPGPSQMARKATPVSAASKSSINVSSKPSMSAASSSKPSVNFPSSKLSTKVSTKAPLSTASSVVRRQLSTKAQAHSAPAPRRVVAAAVPKRLATNRATAGGITPLVDPAPEKAEVVGDDFLFDV